jgi:hypothetical protein
MEHKDKKKEIIPLKTSYKEQEPITKESFIQRASADYKGKFPPKYWV